MLFSQKSLKSVLDDFESHQVREVENKSTLESLNAYSLNRHFLFPRIEWKDTELKAEGDTSVTQIIYFDMEPTVINCYPANNKPDSIEGRLKYPNNRFGEKQYNGKACSAMVTNSYEPSDTLEADIEKFNDELFKIINDLNAEIDNFNIDLDRRMFLVIDARRSKLQNNRNIINEVLKKHTVEKKKAASKMLNLRLFG